MSSDIHHVQASERYSKATGWDGIGHISVQYPEAPGEDPVAQTHEVLGKLDHFMAQLGTDKSKLLKCTVYMARLEDFAAINSVWDAWVVPGRPPARTPVVCEMLRPNVRVGIEAVVAIG
jgi:enamine deaminase RidA (YjgF/YER057c/UK114 family)